MRCNFLYIYAFIAALGGLLSGFDTGVISGALLYINNDWHLNEITQGMIVSSALVGAAFGAFSFGKLTDIIGRKNMFIITSFIFILGSFMCALSQNSLQLIISRFILGLAIGIITFLSPLYLSEISPSKSRGALVSMFQLAITFGILFSYVSNYLIANYIQKWQIMLVAGVIPSIILLIGSYFLIDTPRWYILKGDSDSAKNALLKLNQPQEIENIQQTIKKDAPLKFDKSLILPLITGIGGMFIQQWTGINTIIYYAPFILKSAGFSADLNAVFATVGIGVVNFLMTFFAIFLSDKIGRKPLLYVGLFGMGLSLLALCYSFSLGNDAKYLAFISCILYIVFFSSSLGPVMILVVSEIFPLKNRGQLMSISMMSNFVFNFLLSLLFLPMIKCFGEIKIFMMFAMLSFISVFFVKYVIIETKGISLEDIELRIRNRDV